MNVSLGNRLWKACFLGIAVCFAINIVLVGMYRAAISNGSIDRMTFVKYEHVIDIVLNDGVLVLVGRPISDVLNNFVFGQGDSLGCWIGASVIWIIARAVHWMLLGVVVSEGLRYLRNGLRTATPDQPSR